MTEINKDEITYTFQDRTAILYPADAEWKLSHRRLLSVHFETTHDNVRPIVQFLKLHADQVTTIICTNRETYQTFTAYDKNAVGGTNVGSSNVGTDEKQQKYDNVLSHDCALHILVGMLEMNIKLEVHFKDYFNWLVHIEKIHSGTTDCSTSISSSSKDVYIVKASQDVFQHDLPRDTHELHSVVRGIVLDWPNVLDESYSISDD